VPLAAISASLQIGTITPANPNSADGEIDVTLNTNALATGGVTPYTAGVYLKDSQNTEVGNWFSPAGFGPLTHTFANLASDVYNAYFIVTDSASPLANTDQSTDKSATVPSSFTPLTATSSSLSVTGTTDDTGSGNGTISITLNTDSLATNGSLPYVSVQVYLFNSLDTQVGLAWVPSVNSGTQNNTFTGLVTDSYYVNFVVTDTQLNVATSSNKSAIVKRPLEAINTALTVISFNNNTNGLTGSTSGDITIHLATPYASYGTTPYTVLVYCQTPGPMDAPGSPWTYDGFTDYKFTGLIASTYTLYFEVTDSSNPTQTVTSMAFNQTIS
jgi:hypothetical protein